MPALFSLSLSSDDPESISYKVKSGRAITIKTPFLPRLPCQPPIMALRTLSKQSSSWSSSSPPSHRALSHSAIAWADNDLGRDGIDGCWMSASCICRRMERTEVSGNVS